MVSILFWGLLQLMYTQGVQTAVAARTGLAFPNRQKVVAFPGAEGFGKYTCGGRGGKVVVVTNLKDSGPGSLRKALRMDEPRIVVFAVSGTIDLESSLDINYGDLTIAGQSAPGEGITLRGYPLKIKGDNVIIRYIRSRMGDKTKVQDDAVSAIGQKDIIIDHCSFSWSTDEVASFYDNARFTLQWSIISESLNNSVHEKGEHGYGGIWGGMGASFHHNLLAHHKSRNPRFNGARTHGEPAKEVVDFRNNVIYNWKSNSAYAGEDGNYNIVNNYYKPGPATEDSKRTRIVNPWPPYGSFYVHGNIMEGSEKVTRNNALGVVCDHPDSVLIGKPIPVMALPEQPAGNAYERVLADAGASQGRDAVDRRVVKEVRNGTAGFGENGIIDSQEEVGGWPALKTGEAPVDSDVDGMPDTWEKAKSLDANDPEDGADYSLSKVYTNIEIYLNQLVDAKRKGNNAYK